MNLDEPQEGVRRRIGWCSAKVREAVLQVVDTLLHGVSALRRTR
jgi:hypothetical protein